jgi:uncharacterized protein (DUF486 family)
VRRPPPDQANSSFYPDFEVIFMLTIALLSISNVFMTFAWYGHLKHKQAPLVIAIVVSWLIAFFEYCFQVPANRWGSSQFTPIQLKVIQEIITLIVFSLFAMTYLNQKLGWNHLIAFVLIVAAVFFVRMDTENQHTLRTTALESPRP